MSEEPKKVEMSNGKFMIQRPDGECDECEGFHWLFIPIIYQKVPFKICRYCFGRRMELILKYPKKKKKKKNKAKDVLGFEVS